MWEKKPNVRVTVLFLSPHRLYYAPCSNGCDMFTQNLEIM